MDDEVRKIMRQVTRERIYELWSHAKEKDYEGLDEEEFRIAKIMAEHESEFYNQFEFADLTYDHEYDPDSEYNPFLHISIHLIVENQLEQKNPIEAVQFYNAMRKKKYSRHEAIHLVGQILIYLIFDVMQHKRPFDSLTYQKLLKKYKTRNPEKFANLLENEPLLSDA